MILLFVPHARAADLSPGNRDAGASPAVSTTAGAHGAAPLTNTLSMSRAAPPMASAIFVVEAAPVGGYGKVRVFGQHAGNSRQGHRHRDAFGGSVEVGLQPRNVARRGETQLRKRSRGQVTAGIGRDDFDRTRLGCRASGRRDAGESVGIGRRAERHLVWRVVLVKLPMAVEFANVAPAAKPRAVALVADEIAPLPMAVASAPLAVEPWPKAADRNPDALR